MKAPPQLASFWDGPIKWSERLCVASMVAAGHDLQVFSYDPDGLRKAELPIQVRDAGEIIPEEMSSGFRAAGRTALFANLFRLELQRRGEGIWVDLDCYFLRPLLPKDDHVFGIIGRNRLNNAVLGLPRSSPMLIEYIANITAVPLRMPWATLRRRLGREIEILLGRPLPHPSKATNIGPRALTYFAERHNLMPHAMQEPVFYPVPTTEAPLLAQSDDRPVRSFIKPETTIVHLWHAILRNHGFLKEPPPRSSYLGQALAQHGLL
jgi:hypothetical protein